MKNELDRYRSELMQELENILGYWMEFTVDEVHGGFIGKVDQHNNLDPGAPKGSVLNFRILWSFSASYRLTGNERHLEMAERAYRYILDYFVDKEYGGVFWILDHTGKPLETKKQIYALSFAVYGLSEYYHATRDEEAREAAIHLYQVIVKHSYDKQYGGYIEALSRDWKQLDDLRLSEKDFNEKKSMNTHLHVMEGFMNLYRAWQDEGLKTKIAELLEIFLDRIVDRKTHHLNLFFDQEWNSKARIISYGHDIEAAWLLQQAAEVIGSKALLQKVKIHCLKIARAASKGLDSDGGLWYEYNADENSLVTQKHSWPQAEAMIGFLNAWQVSGENQFLQRSISSWNFVKNYILDKKRGEWYWGVTEDYSLMEGQDKVGLWKCPYHNSRACIEIIQRITSMEKKIE